MNDSPSAVPAAQSQRLDDLIDRCKSISPVQTGVVYPLSADALMGAVQAEQDGLIVPVLVGPAAARCRR